MSNLQNDRDAVFPATKQRSGTRGTWARRRGAACMTSSPLFARQYARRQPDFTDHMRPGSSALAASADYVA
jgi:hypothetical protein